MPGASWPPGTPAAPRAGYGRQGPGPHAAGPGPQPGAVPPSGAPGGRCGWRPGRGRREAAGRCRGGLRECRGAGTGRVPSDLCPRRGRQRLTGVSWGADALRVRSEGRAFLLASAHSGQRVTGGPGLPSWHPSAEPRGQGSHEAGPLALPVATGAAPSPAALHGPVHRGDVVVSASRGLRSGANAQLRVGRDGGAERGTRGRTEGQRGTCGRTREASRAAGGRVFAVGPSDGVSLGRAAQWPACVAGSRAKAQRGRPVWCPALTRPEQQQEPGVSCGSRHQPAPAVPRPRSDQLYVSCPLQHRPIFGPSRGSRPLRAGQRPSCGFKPHTGRRFRRDQ